MAEAQGRVSPVWLSLAAAAVDRARSNLIPTGFALVLAKVAPRGVVGGSRGSASESAATAEGRSNRPGDRQLPAVLAPAGRAAPGNSFSATTSAHPVGGCEQRRPIDRGGAKPTDLDGLIRDVASREGLDEQLVKAVVEAESNFDPKAVSPAGAKGLMQLMDGTARALGVRNPFDPESNLAGGARYLKAMLEKFGSLPLALAAYNAGPGAVERYAGIPPYSETKSYVERVLQLHRRNQMAAAAQPREGGSDGGGRIA